MWRKHCIFPHKTLYIATNHFIQFLSFWSSTQFFFPSWNICFIIPLISITYPVLVHNYNTTKYIYFINSRQRAYISYLYYLLLVHLQAPATIKNTDGFRFGILGLGWVLRVSDVAATFIELIRKITGKNLSLI